MAEEKTVITTCTHDCGGRCLLKAHVKDGVITRIETDDGAEPQLRACARGRAYRQRIYSPDRLAHPLKRIGERGEGRFERISWDEALDTVAGQLKRIKEAHGNSSIFHVSYSGNTGTMLHSQLAVVRLLTMFGGFTPTWGSASFWGNLFASEMTYGTLSTGNTRDDLPNARLIIMWGWNPAESIQITTTSYYMTLAKEAGVKVVAVDPRFTDSAAAFASQWIPIRPGTDTAMLIAMAYVMIRDNLQDQKFLDTNTIGFEQFKNYVMGASDGVQKTPDWAARITGVAAATIEQLATEYATTKPAKLLTLGAPGRTAFGEQFHRAAATLAAMTGNIGIYGGEAAGFGLAPIGLQPLASAALLHGGKPGNLPEGTTPKKGVHITKVWDAILKGTAGGYPADFKMVYTTNGNPVNQFMNSNKAVQALKSLDFVVVHEQFMTATARYADIDLNSPLTKQGLYNLDPTRKGFGYGVNGAMTRYVRVPVRCLHHLPDTLPFEKAGLTEPCCVAYNAVVMNGSDQAGRPRGGAGARADWPAVRGDGPAARGRSRRRRPGTRSHSAGRRRRSSAACRLSTAWTSGPRRATDWASMA